MRGRSGVERSDALAMRAWNRGRGGATRPTTHTRRKGSSAGQTGTRGAIAARLSVGAAGQGRGTHATRGSTHQGSALVLARIAALGGDALNGPITCSYYMHGLLHAFHYVAHYMPFVLHASKPI